MDDSLIKAYEEMDQIQTEQIMLLKKQIAHHKKSLDNLKELVDVQDRLLALLRSSPGIIVVQQQIRHLKVIK